MPYTEAVLTSVCLNDRISPTRRLTCDSPLLECTSLGGLRLYTSRWDLPPHGSVNTDIDVHSSIRPDDGISPTQKRICDSLLMGCAPLGGSHLYTSGLDVPSHESVNANMLTGLSR